MFQDKLDSAVSLLKEHNEAIGGESKTGFVNPQAFIECIKASGATKDELLSSLSYEDILECLPINNGIKPKILAKEIAKIFRGKSDILLNESTNVSAKKAANMTIRELVEAFDPQEPTNPVGERLNKITSGKRFIVYSGQTVDVATTLKMVMEIRSGYPEVEVVRVGDQTKEVFAIGNLPENYADENPLFQNRPLRPDGTCDQTSRSWEGVPLSVRQLIYLAVKSGDIDVSGKNGMMVAHEIITQAISTDAENKLRSIYQKVSLKFDELSKTGALPTLKIVLGKTKKANNRPFDEGKKVVPSSLVRTKAKDEAYRDAWAGWNDRLHRQVLSKI